MLGNTFQLISNLSMKNKLFQAFYLYCISNDIFIITVMKMYFRFFFRKKVIVILPNE